MKHFCMLQESLFEWAIFRAILLDYWAIFRLTNTLDLGFEVGTGVIDVSGLQLVHIAKRLKRPVRGLLFYRVIKALVDL
jgi:hypothetical protein